MPEKIIIKCPFCNDGDIEVLHTPRQSQDMVTRAAGRTKRYSVMKNEKNQVLSKECPVCKKSKSELQKRLSGNESATTSDAARRAKESGLPLKF